jgi:hypothetical protein
MLTFDDRLSAIEAELAAIGSLIDNMPRETELDDATDLIFNKIRDLRTRIRNLTSILSATRSTLKAMTGEDIKD